MALLAGGALYSLLLATGILTAGTAELEIRRREGLGFEGEDTHPDSAQMRPPSGPSPGMSFEEFQEEREAAKEEMSGIAGDLIQTPLIYNQQASQVLGLGGNQEVTDQDELDRRVAGYLSGYRRRTESGLIGAAGQALRGGPAAAAQLARRGTLGQEWDTARLAQLQRDLYHAGLISHGVWENMQNFGEIGLMNEHTQAAVEALVQQAQVNGLDPDELLERRKTTGLETGAFGAQPPPPFVPPVRDPLEQEVIEGGITDTYQKRLGRNPTDDELAEDVKAFRGREAEFWDQVTEHERQKHMIETEQAEPRQLTAPSELPKPGRLAARRLEDDPEAQAFHGTRLILDNLIGRAGRI